FQNQDDNIRGRGTYRKTISIIEEIISTGYGARLVTNLTLCRTNFDNVIEFSDYLKSIGVRHVTYSIFSPTFIQKNVEIRSKKYSLDAIQMENARKLFRNSTQDIRHVAQNCVVYKNGDVSPC